VIMTRDELLQKNIYLIDLDGTVIDSGKRHADVMSGILDSGNPEYADGKPRTDFNADEYLAYKSDGHSGKEYLKEIMGLTPSSADDIQRAWTEQIEFSAYLNKDRLYEDTIFFLNNIYESAGVVFLTARRNVDGLKGELRRLCLDAYADYTIVADPFDAVAQKEKAYIALKKMYPDASFTIVGDTENEYEMALKNKIECRLLNRGFRSRKFWNDRKVRSYDDLIAVYKSLKIKR